MTIINFAEQTIFSANIYKNISASISLLDTYRSSKKN